MLCKWILIPLFKTYQHTRLSLKHNRLWEIWNPCHVNYWGRNRWVKDTFSMNLLLNDRILSFTVPYNLESNCKIITMKKILILLCSDTSALAFIVIRLTSLFNLFFKSCKVVYLVFFFLIQTVYLGNPELFIFLFTATFFITKTILVL